MNPLNLLVGWRFVKQIGSNFDDFLREENLLEAAEATAVKRVVSFQIALEVTRRKDPQVSEKRVG